MSYSRLIDAEVLKERLNKLNWTAEKGFSLRYVLDDIIDNTPTVELDKLLFSEIVFLERLQGEWEYNQYDGNPNIGN